MDQNLYLSLKGTEYCEYRGFGSVPIQIRKDLITSNIRRGVNEVDDCANTPVNTPIIKCNPDIDMKAEYPFIIGEEVQAPSLVYGFYRLGATAVPNPTEVELAIDIAENAENYDTVNLSSNTILDITGDDVSNHVFRVLLASNITIHDITNIDITNTYEVFTDSVYKYYRSKKSIFPTTVKYIINV